ncbi:MAG: hypothetical protein KQI78_08005 [Deltaproteobacteria bacterium]|nr:hypothetical protein [Deltaproteobacteria bacterium]
MEQLNIEWFPFLSDKEFDKLDILMKTFPNDLMPHQIAVSLGVDVIKALAVIHILSEKYQSNMLLLIYHKCDISKIVYARQLNSGFPELPWVCSDCDEEVNSYSDLNFDIMIKFSD